MAHSLQPWPFRSSSWADEHLHVGQVDQQCMRRPFSVLLTIFVFGLAQLQLQKGQSTHKWHFYSGWRQVNWLSSWLPMLIWCSNGQNSVPSSFTFLMRLLKGVSSCCLLDFTLIRLTLWKMHLEKLDIKAKFPTPRSVPCLRNLSR